MDTIIEATWRIYPASALIVAGAIILAYAARAAIAAARIDAFAGGKGLAFLTASRIAIIGLGALLLGVAWITQTLWLAVLVAIIGAGELFESTLDISGLRNSRTLRPPPLTTSASSIDKRCRCPARTRSHTLRSTMEIRRLTPDDVGVVAAIDRSERVHRQYHVVEGKLRERPVTMAEIPPWTSSGTGPHTVASKIDFCRERLLAGGQLLAALDGNAVLGVAVVEPAFDPPLARLAFLHVSRPHRRSGVGAALWRSAVHAAMAAEAEALYVSAVPTGSAVDFYLRQGCALATPPHPRLFDEEPEDIHLVLPLSRSQVRRTQPDSPAPNPDPV